MSQTITTTPESLHKVATRYKPSKARREMPTFICSTVLADLWAQSRLPQKDMAEAFGVSQPRLSSYINSKGLPPLELMEKANKLREVLGLQTWKDEDILTWHEEDSKIHEKWLHEGRSLGAKKAHAARKLQATTEIGKTKKTAKHKKKRKAKRKTTIKQKVAETTPKPKPAGRVVSAPTGVVRTESRILATTFVCKLFPVKTPEDMTSLEGQINLARLRDAVQKLLDDDRAAATKNVVLARP